MPQKTSDFDYDLPSAMIAQASVEPRDQSKLLVLDRERGTVEHRRFFEIGSFLRPGDVLVFNQSKVFRARLRGTAGGKPVEIFLLRSLSGTDGTSRWQALGRPGKRLSPGSRVVFPDQAEAEVISKGELGVLEIEFNRGAADVFRFADAHGEVPVPPYVKRVPEALEQYQTVYARDTGSVAAPTAGFHFTQSLLDELRQSGVQTEFVTLHVGLGTFMPVKTETLDEHPMHSEFVEIDAATAGRIAAAKREGRRVIAVGTTTVRALEGAAAIEGAYSHTTLRAYAGDVNLFITPGFPFRVIDGLVTNFHLPKSTLLALVSAFAGLARRPDGTYAATAEGREYVLSAYEEAKREGYRFYSFGDAMLIL